jgi:putative hydrolase of the HAD superfamily
MQIKAITIDFWNTIYDSSNGKERNDYRQRVLIDNIDKHGLNIMAEKYHEAMQATWKFFEDHWTNNHRTPEAKESVNFIWNYLDLPEDKEALDNVTLAFEDSVLKYPPKLIPQAKERIEQLSEEFPLGIISDTGFSPGTILKELLEKDDMLKYFTSFSFSNETGHSKPNPKAFSAALIPLKCNAKEGLHIGDIEDTDVRGAYELGMRSIRFTGSETIFTSRRNTEDTKADFMTDNWDEIYEIIQQIK